ncbi:uncharacterized protein [Antedon mediterranea]|uniref:uncharacterized protein n=1 Tax=Antedon mediterranea TaxID=105859 RepID=UPI003AF50D07
MSYNFLMVFLFLYVNWSIGVKVACRTSNDASFETVCECTERTRTVNCSNRGLNEWPVGIPINTYYLYMSDNNLRAINDDTLLKLPELRVIYAAYNLLTDISTAFNDLPKLSNVYIQHNSITSLDNTLFKDSPSINKLDISFNQIHTIEPFTFAKLQLSVIDIQYNHNLQRLCENSFALTTRLNYGIVIANNNIVHISTGTFKNVTGASVIFLSGNSLRNIPSRAFQGGNTHLINLEENKISFIHKDAFVALDSIHILRLANNRFTEVPILNNNLDIIDLSWNYITSLEGGQLPSVKTLIVNKNNIQRISKIVFANMSSLEMFFLYGNGITNITYETFKTIGSTLEYIYLFDNKLEQIGTNALSHMVENGTIYLNCGGLRSILTDIGKPIKTICVRENTEIDIDIEGDLLKFIRGETGLTCNSKTRKCSPCKEGTYQIFNKYKNKCEMCPPGGFYQDRRGVIERNNYTETCQKCPIGSFSDNAGAVSIADCQTCPSGTNTSTFANLNACYCLDNFYRTNRYGQCFPCPEGVNCEGGYQNLTKGYWWSWEFKENCSVVEEQNETPCLSEYTAFITKLQTDTFPIDNPNELKDAVYKGPLPKVYPCPFGEKSCNIGRNLNDTCAEGYTGWFCAACSSGYYDLFNECHKCQGPAVTVIIFVSVCFAVIGVIFLIWRTQQRNVDNRNINLDSFVTYLKIAINFYQVLGILSEVTEIHWPKNFEYAGRILQYFDVIRYISMLSPRCLHETWNAYYSLRIAMATPLFIVLTMFTVYFIRCIWNKCHGAITQSWIRDRCIVMSMLLLYLTYANTCADIMAVGPWSIRVFNVTSDGKINKPVLTSDYSIDMDQHGGSTYQTNKTLVYVALTYIIGFPLVIVIMLYCQHVRCTQREQNNGQGWMIGVRFFCGQYKQAYWFWESFELYSKALLALIANLKDDVSSSMSYSLFSTVIFIVLHLYLQPMKEKSEQRFQLLTLVFIVVNLSIGAIVNMDESSSEDDVIGLLHKITPVILIMLNVSIMLAVIVDFVKKLKTDFCLQESGIRFLRIDDDDDPEESQIDENNII